jgi:hypothetical protein
MGTRETHAKTRRRIGWNAEYRKISRKDAYGKISRKDAKAQRRIENLEFGI